MSELPQGWVIATIEDIAKYVQRGKQPKYIDFSDLPVVNQKCVRWHGIDTEYLKFVHPDQWGKWSDERFLELGDILWNSTGTGTIGRATIYQGLPKYEKVVVDSHVTIIRIAEGDSKFLHFWIMSPEIQKKIAEMHTGSTNQVELSRTEVLKTQLPLPPLNEQRRIVAKLEKLLAKCEASKQRLDRIPHILKRFRQSILAAACSGRLTADWRTQNPNVESASELRKRIEKERQDDYQGRQNDPVLPKENSSLELPETWDIVTLDQMSLFITSGSRGWAKYYADSGSYFIRAQDINTDELKIKDVAYVNPPSGTEGERTQIQLGDLLITITGANVTKSALVKAELDKAAYVNQHV